MEKKLCILFILISFTMHSSAQDSLKTRTAPDKVLLGLGMGMNYGGIGLNLLVYPQENIGIFGSVGYALMGIGYNAGFKARIVGKISPYVLAMYGYNAVIVIKNASTYDKFFYGPTLGIGMDFRGHPERGYFSLGLLIPVRGQEVDDYMNDLEKNHGVVFSNKLSPVGLSFGYHFTLN